MLIWAYQSPDLKPHIPGICFRIRFKIFNVLYTFWLQSVQALLKPSWLPCLVLCVLGTLASLNFLPCAPCSLIFSRHWFPFWKPFSLSFILANSNSFFKFGLYCTQKAIHCTPDRSHFHSPLNSPHTFNYKCILRLLY